MPGRGTSPEPGASASPTHATTCLTATRPSPVSTRWTTLAATVYPALAADLSLSWLASRGRRGRRSRSCATCRRLPSTALSVRSRCPGGRTDASCAGRPAHAFGRAMRTAAADGGQAQNRCDQNTRWPSRDFHSVVPRCRADRPSGSLQLRPPRRLAHKTVRQTIADPWASGVPT